MSASPSTPTAQPGLRAALVLAIVAGALSACVLGGWALGVPAMTSVVPETPTMKANTAVCFLLLAVAVGLRAATRIRGFCVLASLVSGTIAAAVLSQWLLSVDLGIDQLLVSEGADAVGTPAAGRMSPNTSACVVLIALAMVLDAGRPRSRRITTFAAVTAIVIAFVALTGYLLDIPALSGMPHVTHMAIPTAAAVVLLASGALLTSTHNAVIELLTSPTSGGQLVRRLLPVVVGVPSMAAVVHVRATDEHWIAHATSVWAFLVIVTAVMVGVTVWLARRLERAQRLRVAGEERLKASEALARTVIDAAAAPIVGADAEAVITLFNPAAEKLFGWTEEEAIGRNVVFLMPERLHADQLAWQQAQRASGIAGMEGVTIELPGLARDGRELDLEWSFASARSEVADVSVIAILHDVAARKRAEQASRSDAERLARVVDAQNVIAAQTRNTAAVMDVIADRACAVVGADGAVVELPSGDQMVYRATVGAAAPHAGLRTPIAGSLSGAAFRTATTLHCADTERDDRVDRELTRAGGIRSMICVPLRHRHDVVGVVKVMSREPQAFTDRDERTLELLAGLGGAAIQRAQDDRVVATHHVVASALAQAATLEGGVAAALRGMGETIGVDVAALWLAPQEGDALQCVEVWHGAAVPGAAYARAARAATPRAGEGVLGQVWAMSRPIWTEDVPAHKPEPADEARMAAAVEAGLTTIVDVAIVAHGESLGVLQLGARAMHTARPQDEAELLIIAGQIGQFVHRKLEQQRVADRAADLAAVVELAQSVTRLRDPAQVRPALSSAMKDITGADQVVIFEPEGDGRLVATAQTGDRLPEGHVIALDGPSAAGAAFLAGQGLYVDDALSDARVHRESARTSGLRSAYLEPLLRDGEAVGVVSISWHVRRRTDPAELRSLIRLLAAETANALERADLVAALDASARTDQLTGVANRRAWDERLPPELARARRTDSPLSVALIDLDHFKAYNDAEGHQAGDRLLREASAAWAARLRTTDMLARWGGEEFAVLLPGCGDAVAAAVLEELRRAMPEGATCSVGVAEWDGSESPEELAARADAALYEAKRTGRDRVVVLPRGGAPAV